MNIIPMINKILSVANPVIGKTALPDFRIAADERAEFMGVRALDQLDCAFDGYVPSGSEKQMHMVGHKDEGVQRVAPFAAVVIKSFEE